MRLKTMQGYMASLALAILCIAFNNAHSQAFNHFLGDVAMPAPNAASLGRYGDVPVSHYTGVPRIEVPFYTLEEGPLSLPVFLSYHARGIKVAEIASWAGAGWTLHAGGMISRTVLGYPDEQSPYGYYFNGENINGGSQELIQLLEGSEIDTEPDIFTFSIPGYSGKFYIDKDHQCQFVPRQDLKISWSGTFEQFTLLTPEGNRYIFGKHSQGNALVVDRTLLQDEAFEITSSWHLVRVETHDGRFHIDLEYEDENYGYRQLASCWHETFECTGLGGVSSSTSTGCASAYGVIDGNHLTLKSSIRGKRLKRISCSTAAVNFIGEAIREDLEPHVSLGNSARRLDRIEIVSGSFCKKFSLAYDYFQDMRTLGNFPLYSLSESKRLKLLSIREQSCDGALQNPPYVFTYEGETMTQTIGGNNVTRQFLPYRLSKETDHWGYFNAQSGNENLLVHVPPTTVTLQSGATISYGQANRTPQENPAMTGILRKMEYPTGGHTSFEYESNRYFSEETQLSALWKLENHPYPDPSQVCGYTEEETVFTFDPGALQNAVYKLTLGYPAQSCPNTGPVISLWVEAYNNATGAFIGQVELNQVPLPGGHVTTLPASLQSFGNASIPAGVPVKFVLKAQDGWARFEVFSSTVAQISDLAGGLRIRKITTHDGISSTNDMVRVYEYLDENNPGQSSGALIAKPLYGLVNQAIVPSGQGMLYPLSGVNHISFYAESQVPLGGFDGVEIAYRQVTERLEGSGRTSYQFFLEVATPASSYPLPPPQHYYRNGKTKGMAQYREDGVAVSTTSNESPATAYSLSPGVIYKHIRRPGACPWPGGSAVPVVFKTDYKNRTNRYRVFSTTSNLDGVVSTVNYSYDPQNRHSFPVEKSMLNSDGKQIKTRHRYVFDLSDNCLRNQLLNRNIIGLPTSTRVLVNGNLVGGDSTHWSFYNNGLPGAACNASNHPYPWKFYTWEIALDDNNAALAPGKWAEKGEVNQRHAQSGLPKRFTLSGGWAPEEFQWGAGGLIVRHTYGNFVKEYAYQAGTRLLSGMTDIDGQSVYFKYDPLMRLQESSGRDGKVKTSFAYFLGNPEEWQGGNKIVSTTDYADFEDQTVVQHFDGLGRPLDTWKPGYGPQGQDIVAARVFYDKQGRVARKAYLPDIKAALTYSDYAYEPSPLSRLLSETYPDGHQLKTSYGSENNYFLQALTDENGNTVSGLSDILGRRYETRNALGHSTRFYYDDKNNLQKIINPEQQEYRYGFDARNRMIRKSIPGAHCQDFYYDSRDLLIASRDGNLYHGGDPSSPPLNQWLVNEYDIHGRLVRTGFGSPSQAVNFPPCSNLLPEGLAFSISEALVVNTYDVQGLGGCNSFYAPTGKLGSQAARVIRSDGTLGELLTTAWCYDEYGRISTSASDLFEAGLDVVNTTYDIADHVLNTNRNYNGSQLLIQEELEYDHGGRLLHHGHRIEGMAASPGEVSLASLQYNTKDQLVDKLVGNLAGMTYLYNIRGWLTHINHMPFGNTQGTLTCESPLPPSGQGDVNKCGECGDELMNLEQIRNLRFQRKLSVDCFIACDCELRCAPADISPCADGAASTGGDFPAETAGLNYPSWLYEIHKCSGEEAHILEKDVPHISESYAVKGRISLESPAGQFRLETEEGSQQVDMEGLFELVNEGGSFEVRTGRESPCFKCDPNPPACTPAEASGQAASMAALQSNLIQSAAALQFPSNLLRIRLCSGKEIYLFEEELQYLSGSFSLLQNIEVRESNQRLILESGTGNVSNVYLSYYLQIRDLNPGWVINYYRPCQENQCSSVGEKHYVRTVGASTLFSSYDGTAPYQNLTQVSPHSSNSLLQDGQNWNATVSGGSGEAQWDAAVLLPPDIQPMAYQIVVYIPQLNAVNCRIGLHNGSGFVKINGGQDFVTLNGGSFNQMPFLVLVPDDLPTVQEIAGMKVALSLQSRSVSIDAVYAEIDFMEPCDRCALKHPSCTAQELAAQQASLAAIQALAQSIPVSEIPMPAMLYRIKLCDGQEIYLLHHELAMLQGNYTILQTIAVTSLNQTFVTGFPAVTTPTAFTGAPPPRYDLFALKLLYYANDPQVKSLHKGYNNGNIATMYWQVTGRDRQVYSFLYDKPDRLRHGFYAEINEQGTYFNRGLYDEWSVTYDKIGNIEALNRRGAWGGCDNNGQFLFEFGTIDDLSYQYSGDRSRLTTIQDGVFGDAGLKGIRANQNAYDYDYNGNLIADSGKGVNTFYNHLNLPRQLDVQSGSNNNAGSIQWVYDALGNRLKKTSSESGNTSYHHGIEHTEGAIFVYHSEGRVALYPPEDVNAPPVPWRYEYSMDDHLGNVRLTFSDLNGDGYIQANPGDWAGDGSQGNPAGYSELLQENHYYPFGMSMEGQWRMPASALKANRYQFNGIERHEDMNVDLDLATFRSYDAAMARWLHVDPMAENAPSLTAYRMGFNNPVRFSDPLGLFESEKEAKKYAKSNGIRTGWFSRNKIVEQQDGTFAIENRRQRSFITAFTDADCHTQVIKGALYVEKGVHLSELGWEAYSQLNNPLSEHYNPHAVVFTGGSDILYAAGSLLGFASPAGRAANLGRAVAAAGDAAPAYETVYRTMSSTSAEIFLQTGRMPAGTETFISTSESFAKNFSGVFFEINLKQGTLNQLQGIGVRNLATAHPYPNMPLVGKGWRSTNAFFKIEGSTMNIGLGNGKALDYFNENIINYSAK